MEDVKQTSGVQVPLVDATIEFLTEFLPEDRKAKLEEENKKVNARMTSTSSSNGASIAGSSSSKGKERSMTPQPEDDLCPFIPTGIYDALKTKKQFDSMRGGQQEDAEEFLGFYLEGLEEELTTLTETLTHVESSTLLEGKNKKKGATAVEETEEDAPPEAEQDGWMEVGKRNRTVVTRTVSVSILFCSYLTKPSSGHRLNRLIHPLHASLAGNSARHFVSLVRRRAQLWKTGGVYDSISRSVLFTFLTILRLENLS